MNLKTLTILTTFVVVLLASNLCYARLSYPISEDAFRLYLQEDPDGNSKLNSTDETTTDEFSKSTMSRPYMRQPEFSVFKMGLGFSYSTNDFVVVGGNIEIGAPNIFDGLSFAFGMGTGWIASDSSQEFGFFFCVDLMVKYTFDIDKFYYPGVGVKYLGGGAINLVGESKEYDTYGLTGFVRLPFLAVFLLESNVTLELITDSSHSVGLCFDVLLGLHF